MADERLPLPPCRRSASMLSSSCDIVWRRSLAIFRKHSQNPSSRLMLVLCPAMTTERLAIVDFMIVTPRWQKEANNMPRLSRQNCDRTHGRFSWPRGKTADFTDYSDRSGARCKTESTLVKPALALLDALALVCVLIAALAEG